MHIAHGIDVDQEPDSRDDEQHDAREGIDEIGEIDGEIAAEDPLDRRRLHGVFRFVGCR